MSDGKRILVVDDEPDLARIAVIRLEKAGYEVVVATNGREALDEVYGGDFNLILLDLRLPEIDGPEVCRILKGPGSEYSHIPIIMFTATADNIEEEYKRIGADDYVMKPFDAGELLDKIKSYVERP